jgi:anti-sigma factor RsiW
MISEELEFQISQYVDGTLSTTESAALEQKLVADDEARRVLAEYRKLHQHVTGAMPLPAIAWDRLAERLSGAVANAQQPEIAGRIGWSRTFAIAASVLIVASISILIGRTLRPNHPSEQPVNSIAEVIGPQAEAATGASVVQITIGPSPALAARAASWRYAEGVVTRPSRVELAGAIYPPADGDSHIH